MSYVITCMGMAGRTIRNPGQLPPIGQWLKSYDPEAHDGQGEAEWTADPDQARRFDTQGEAFALYQRVPERRPVRADGQPNRPLTAFTVMIDEIPNRPEGGQSKGDEHGSESRPEGAGHGGATR